MNAEKYTQKSGEALRIAQEIARENNNQFLTAEHLLYALIDQDGGLIPSLMNKMGADSEAMLAALDGMIDRLPRVTGTNGELYASGEVSRALSAAEKRQRNCTMNMCPLSI